MDQMIVGQLLMKMGDLPSLPHVATRVLQLTDNSESNPAELSDVICQDQVMVSKVLKVVNSAYYGLPRRVATIQEAITILGLKPLRTLIIGAAVYKTLGTARTLNGSRPEQIWRHALACAASSQAIAQELGVAQKEHAFIAGLLHDIGKIILGSYMTEHYDKVLELQNKRGCSLVEAEREILGTDHAEVGRAVAEKWNLPTVLVEPIGFHHQPLDKFEHKELVIVVHLADIMAMMAGYTTAGAGDYSMDPEVLAVSGLSYDLLFKKAQEIKGTIKIDL